MLGMVGWDTSSSSSFTQETYPCDNCNRPQTNWHICTNRTSRLECLHILCETCYKAIPGQFIFPTQSDINKITSLAYEPKVQQFVLNCYYCRNSFLNNKESWYINTAPTGSPGSLPGESEWITTNAIESQKMRLMHPLKTITPQSAAALEDNFSDGTDNRKSVRAARTFIFGGAVVIVGYATYKLYQWWTTKPEDNNEETTTEVDTQNQEQQKQTT